MDVGIILLLLLVVFVVIALQQSLKIIKQQQIAVVERLGKFRRTLEPGPHLLVPLVDRVRYTMDMREEVQAFPPQGVITEENLMVNIDSVIYFQIVDPVRAAYEAQNYRGAIEQLTMTTLRNIIGGMDLERALTSREEINNKLRAVLDEATGKWGIKVNRVELRAIEPPATIRDAMEKGARAERDKRAQILLAEGQRQSQILSAGGERESAILRAQGDREAAVLRAQADRQAQMLRAEGEAQAITTVFNAIHAGEPDQGLLAYQYMQMLPALARGDSNKVWIVPSELNDALKGLCSAVGDIGEQVKAYAQTDKSKFSAPDKVDVMAEIQAQTDQEREQSDKTVQSVIEEAEKLSNPAFKTRRPQQVDPAPADPALSAGATDAALGTGEGDGLDVVDPGQAQPQPAHEYGGTQQPPAGPAYQTGWEPPSNGQQH